MKNVRATQRHALLVLALLLVAIAIGGAAQASTTWYVATTGSDSANDGMSAGAPFKTIGNAIGKAAGGDTVLIADGTYNEHDLDFGGKAITVCSQSDDPYKCILDCQSAGR